MANDRIKNKFGQLSKESRAGLITFLTAGDPDMATGQNLLNSLPESGADLIELGIPFSDPMADGPVIQASSQRALKAGITLNKILSMVSQFRTFDNTTPIILMGYYNPIYRYGAQKFFDDARKAGVDGLIIVDLPVEENELLEFSKSKEIDLIYLIAPTTDERRLPIITRQASGFLYYVSMTGITGTRSANRIEVEDAFPIMRQYTELPIAVGFGIKTAKQAKEIAMFADAVVVGSALVSIIEKNLEGINSKVDKKRLCTSVLKQVSNLSKAIKAAPKSRNVGQSV